MVESWCKFTMIQMFFFFFDRWVYIDLYVVQDERKMALFAQYAMAATEEALEDAGWKPEPIEQREATVWMSFSILSSMMSKTENDLTCAGGLSWLGNW